MKFCLALIAAVSVPSFVHAAPLPGGAGSVVETYQDWIVACNAPNNVASCVMRQVQNNPQTGQHVLTAELRNVATGKLEGAFLMPFGLALAQGVTLKVDETAFGQPLAFSTCLPNGCLAPVNFDALQVAKLKTGSSLDLSVQAVNAAQPIALNISLSGFTAALGRITELTK